MNRPDPTELGTAWSILAENYGMVARKWQAAWPRWRQAMTDPEVLSASLDAAVRGVAAWRPDGGSSLKTFVLNGVYFAARHARECWARERRRPERNRSEWDEVPARTTEPPDLDRLKLLDRLCPADRLLVETVAEHGCRDAADRLGMSRHLVRQKYVSLTATLRAWSEGWDETEREVA